MAMFEFALSITAQQNQMLLPPIIADKNLNENEKKLLRLLADLGDSNILGAESSKPLCNCLRCKSKANQNSDKSNLCNVSIKDLPHCESDGQMISGYSFVNSYFLDEESMEPGSEEYSSSFPLACVMYKPDAHRVLIQPNDPNSSSTYGLYACNSGNRCDFECGGAVANEGSEKC